MIMNNYIYCNIKTVLVMHDSALHVVMARKIMATPINVLVVIIQ